MLGREGTGGFLEGLNGVQFSLKILFLIHMSVNIIITNIKYSVMNTSLNNSQLLFQKNKQQILNSKKEYLQEYVKQIENNIASIWEANQHYKHQIQECKRKGENMKGNGDIERVIEKYQREEKEKIKKIDQLKKLIQEYKFLCEEASRFSNHALQSDQYQN